MSRTPKVCPSCSRSSHRSPDKSLNNGFDVKGRLILKMGEHCIETAADTLDIEDLAVKPPSYQRPLRKDGT